MEGRRGEVESGEVNGVDGRRGEESGGEEREVESVDESGGE